MTARAMLAALSLFPALALAQDTTGRSAAAGRTRVPFVRPGVLAAAQAVDTQKIDAARLHGTDIARIIGAAPQTVKIRRARGTVEEVRTDSVTLNKGDVLWTSVGTRAVWRHNVIGRDSGLALSLRAVRASSYGAQGLAVLTLPQTLTYEASRSAYAGTLQLWLSDSLHPTNADTLAPAIQLIAGLPVGSVQPPSVAFEHVNLPPESIQIATTSPDDSVPLEIRTSAGERSTVWLRVAHPQIAVRPARRTIWGYGLGKTAVYVTMPQEAGTAKRDVVLQASFSEPVPSRLTLAGGETGEVSVRSSGVQVDSVWANGGGFGSPRVPITYKSPWTFILAALIGGLVGAWLAKSHSGRSFITHALVGFVIAVGIAIGINFTGITMPTGTGEAVVFFAAVIGARGGMKLFDTVLATMRKTSGATP